MPKGRVRVPALTQYTTTRYSGVRPTLHNPKTIFFLIRFYYHPKINSLPCTHKACAVLFGGLKTNVLIREGGFFSCCVLSDCQGNGSLDTDWKFNSTLIFVRQE